MSAPKKIWVGNEWKAHPRGPLIKSEKYTPYIRADIVDELVEALEYCIKHIPEFADVPGIKAALKKLEENNDKRTAQEIRMV
jgi:hypothetical protein